MSCCLQSVPSVPFRDLKPLIASQVFCRQDSLTLSHEIDGPDLPSAVGEHKWDPCSLSFSFSILSLQPTEEKDTTERSFPTSSLLSSLSSSSPGRLIRRISATSPGKLLIFSSSYISVLSIPLHRILNRSR